MPRKELRGGPSLLNYVLVGNSAHGRVRSFPPAAPVRGQHAACVDQEEQALLQAKTVTKRAHGECYFDCLNPLKWAFTEGAHGNAAFLLSCLSFLENSKSTICLQGRLPSPFFALSFFSHFSLTPTQVFHPPVDRSSYTLSCPDWPAATRRAGCRRPSTNQSTGPALEAARPFAKPA